MALAGSGIPGRAPAWLLRRGVALLSVLVLLAACSGSDDGGSEGGGEEAQEGGGEEAQEDGGAVTVTVWFNGETVPSDDFAPLEEQGINVEWDIRGDAIITDLLRMRDAGQELPDLVEIDSHLIPAMLEAGLLQPMTGQISAMEEDDPDLYATVPESVWEDGTFDGEIYHWPNKSLVDALYYNTALLEDAGVDPPPYDSYWELLDAARAIQAANPDLPAYFATGGTSPDRLFRWLYAFGAPFEGNVPDLTSEQGIEMIEWLQTMHAEGITNPEFVIGQQDEAPGAFVSGELPFIDEGINNGPGFSVDDFSYGEGWLTAPNPLHEGGIHMGAPRGWSITAETGNADEAGQVIRYFADPEIAAERYFELESGVPQSIPVLEGDQMAEEQPFFTPELLDAFRNLEATIPPGTNTNAVGEILNDMLEEVSVTGTDDSPEEIAERYQPMLDELL